MADAVLTIDTPEGPIEIPISGLDLDAAAVSDSRPRMPDLKKIAKAFGLSEDASEEQILAKIAERAEAQSLDATKVAEALGADKADEDAIIAKAKELADGSTEQSLEDRAKAEGKRVVTDSDFSQLVSDAAAGRKASDDLKQARFDNEYKTTLDEVRVDAKDETRERWQKLYDLDADATIDALKALPKLANTDASGTGKNAGEAPEGVDQDRFDLDQEVRAYQADHDGVSYEDAIDRVLAKRSAS